MLMTNRIRKNVGTLAVAVGLFAMAGAALPPLPKSRSGLRRRRIASRWCRRRAWLYLRARPLPWDGRQYVWNEGQFIQERPGHKYTPYAFERRGEVWYYRPASGTTTRSNRERFAV
jgi:hypothetical protein